MTYALTKSPDIPLPEIGEISRNRAEIIDYMQQIAPPGLDYLDFYQENELRQHTRQLVAEYGEAASQEYGRYVATKDRDLSLPAEKLHEQLGGKTILVTGGTGLIGSELLAQLSLFNPGRLVSISRGLKKPFAVIPNVEYHKADLTNKQSVDQVIDYVRPDIIYHLAAEKHPAIAEVEVHRTLSTNIFGTQNLLRAAEATGVDQIIYASTGKATRPFSPDTYASSKKGAEWLMSQAARCTDMTISGTRFTHVVDYSNIITRIGKWIESDEAIRLHLAEHMFYVQSAKESAQLLLNAGIETTPGKFNLHALRNLDWPINLTDLAIGAIQRAGTNTPIYFCGVESGYEEKAWPILYDPMTSGDVSPLINFNEAPQTNPSNTCPEVDVFSLEIDQSAQLTFKLSELRTALQSTDDPDYLRQMNWEFSWAMLSARLDTLPLPVLERAVKRVTKCQEPNLSEEHLKTNRVVLEALARRSA